MDSARLSMPDTLMVLQERVRQRDALVLEQAKVLAEKNEAITRLTKDLQERIGHGLSTGDRLRDLVLAAHGYDPMLEEKYRELEDTLQGKKGEFVLISWQKMVRAYGPRDDMRSVSLYRLGVLEDEKVIPCIAKDLGPFTLHVACSRSRFLDLLREIWTQRRLGVRGRRPMLRRKTSLRRSHPILIRLSWACMSYRR